MWLFVCLIKQRKPSAFLGEISRLVLQTGHRRRVGSFTGVFGSAAGARDWRLRSSCSSLATAKLLNTFLVAPSSAVNGNSVSLFVFA